MHNLYHDLLKSNMIDIKFMILKGISRANAYIIKANKADTVKPTSGRKRIIAGRLKGSFFAKVRNGDFCSAKAAWEWLKNDKKINVSYSTVINTLES